MPEMDSMYQAMYESLGKRNAFTVHNVNGRRYYSSIDATILLNGHEVSEVVQIQWSIEEQTMPLFGYNSYTFDEVVHGARIVSGQFAINFTVPDYLINLISNKATDASMTFSGDGTKENKNDLHKPIYGTTFEIGIGYGSDDKVTGKQPCIFFDKVHLKSCGSALDIQGAGVVEMYSFLARDTSSRR